MRNNSETRKEKCRININRDQIKKNNYALIKNSNNKGFRNNSKPQKIKLIKRINDNDISNSQIEKKHTKNNSMIFFKNFNKFKNQRPHRKDIKTEYSLCQKELKSLMEKEEELKLLKDQLKMKTEYCTTYNNFEITNRTMKSKKKNNKLDDDNKIKKYRKNLSMMDGGKRYERMKMDFINRSEYRSKSKNKDNNSSKKKNKVIINSLKFNNRIFLFDTDRNNTTANTDRKHIDKINKNVYKFSLSFKNKNKKRNYISINKPQNSNSSRYNKICKDNRNLNNSLNIYKKKNMNISYKDYLTTNKNSLSINKEKKAQTNHNIINPKGSEKKIKKKLVLNSFIKNITNEKNEKKSKNANEKIKIRKIEQIGIITKAGEEDDGGEKINQDDYFDYDLSCGYKFIGVCDGHGEDGQNVSDYLKCVLPEELDKELNNFISSENKKLNILESMLAKNRNELSNNDEINKDDKKDKEQNNKLDESLDKLEKIKELFIKVFTSTNVKLIEDNYMFNLENSGSTCVSVFLKNTKINKIYTANVGDSRAIIVKEKNNNNIDNKDKLSYEQLSRDHTCEEKDEAERILNHGGEIQKIQNEKGEWEGPLRIYMKNEEGPGLAMTRSFGDVMGSILGVIAEPEVTEYLIKKEDKAIIIASDGLWEYISNEEVANIVQNLIMKNNANLIVNELYKISFEKWKSKETGIDDITIICLLLN